MRRKCILSWMMCQTFILGFGEGGEGFYLLGGPNTEGHIICKSEVRVEEVRLFTACQHVPTMGISKTTGMQKTAGTSQRIGMQQQLFFSCLFLCLCTTN